MAVVAWGVISGAEGSSLSDVASTSAWTGDYEFPSAFVPEWHKAISVPALLLNSLHSLQLHLRGEI